LLLFYTFITIRDSNNYFEKFKEDIFNNSLSNGYLLAFILGVFAFSFALYMGAYPDQLKPLLPVTEKNRDFYTWVAVFSILLIWREASVSYGSNKSQQELKAAMNVLERTEERLIANESMLITVPTRDVMQIFSEINRQVDTRIQSNQKELHNNIDFLDNTIRYCLSMMIEAAELLTKQHDARFAANIMIYKKISNVKDIKLDGIMKLISPYVPFEKSDSMKAELRGLLILKNDLSVSNDSRDIDKDKDLIRTLILPVPAVSISKSDDLKRYHPGAVAALIEDFHVILDAHKLVELYCCKKNKFSQLCYEGIRYDQNYYRKNKLIRRTLSIRYNHQGTNKGRGVINIYCNKNNILAEPWKLHAFLHLTKSIKWHISYLMRIRSELKIHPEEASQE
jgi:hypothetical protein